MSEITKEEALQIAAKYGMEAEVQYAINCGCYPEDALADWDIIPNNDSEDMITLKIDKEKIEKEVYNRTGIEAKYSETHTERLNDVYIDYHAYSLLLPDGTKNAKAIEVRDLYEHLMTEWYGIRDKSGHAAWIGYHRGGHLISIVI